MAYSKHVATQQYALLALVGAAAERSMPLETAFAAFGHERGGWMRRRTAEIVDMLYHGASLPAALKAVPGALPPEAVPLVCVGYENGSLGPAIARPLPPATSMSRSGNRSCPRSAISASCRPWPWALSPSSS